jgi:hypothetical protein
MTKYSLSIGWQFYFPLCVKYVAPPVFKNRNRCKKISPPKLVTDTRHLRNAAMNIITIMKIVQKIVDQQGIDPCALRMRTARSTI